MYQDDNSRLAYGLISYFLLISFECQHGVNLDCAQCKNQVFAVVTPVIPSPDIKLANDSVTGARVFHIVPCYHPNDVHVAVHACAILEKLVYMSFSDQECVFVAELPNLFESD